MFGRLINFDNRGKRFEYKVSAIIGYPSLIELAIIDALTKCFSPNADNAREVFLMKIKAYCMARYAASLISLKVVVLLSDNA